MQASTTLSKDDLTLLAKSLLEVRATGKPCAPLTERNPELTLQDAYAISETILSERMRQEKVKVVGKKIGLTSRAVQRQLGVAEPDFGYLTSDMKVASGGVVSMKRLLQPRVEGELAYVLKKDLKGPGVTVEDVIAATDYVLPCIEIIDSRVKDWKIKIQDTVADNASSAFFVVGAQRFPLRQEDIRLTGMALRLNGDVVSTGCGAACLDHPTFAVAWLANALSRYGVELKAGEVILSGAFGPVVPVRAGDKVEVSFSGLGNVSCSFGD
jgi:2-oxopent-4-enoate/cis-2-oxohex-4-enoate hydratase